MASAEELVQHIREHRGYVYPYQEFLAKEDPEFLKAQYSMYEIIRRKRALPQQYKELLFVIVSVAKLHEPGMRTHMTKALQLGATKEELIETLEVADILCGGHQKVSGFRVLMEVLDGRPVSEHPKWASKSPQQER